MLKIEIEKRADGAGLLRCTRPGPGGVSPGGVTWQKQPERHAVHFVHHDLTHHAVETVLGCRRGFFGLIAEGWSIEDTTGKGPRGPLPPEASEVESLVGLFDTERASGTLWTPEEFIAFAPPMLGRQLNAETICAIRAARAARAGLFKQWHAAPEGGTLKLTFDGC